MKINPPIIDLEEIILRDICEYDSFDLYEIGKDKTTVEFLSWGPFKSQKAALWIIINEYLPKKDIGLPVGYAIIYKKTNKMIGFIEYHTYNHCDNSAEIGFFLNREYQNMGIMTKCLKQMVIQGFEFHMLSKVIAGFVILNTASSKTIKKCGFKYYKTLSSLFYYEKTNEFLDVIYYDITKEEYILKYHDNDY